MRLSWTANTQADAQALAAQVAEAEDFHPLCALPEATAILLFSESNTRFLCEVRPEQREAFEQALADVPHALVGEVVATKQLQIIGLPAPTPGAEPGDPVELTAAVGHRRRAGTPEGSLAGAAAMVGLNTIFIKT